MLRQIPKKKSISSFATHRFAFGNTLVHSLVAKLHFSHEQPKAQALPASTSECRVPRNGTSVKVRDDKRHRFFSSLLTETKLLSNEKYSNLQEQHSENLHKIFDIATKDDTR